MSAEAIAAVLHHSEARGTDKLVLIGIAWHTNDNPEFGCFPSQETLAAYSNVSVRQVRRALEHLEQAGEIEIVRHGGLSAGVFHRTATSSASTVPRVAMALYGIETYPQVGLT